MVVHGEVLRSYGVVFALKAALRKSARRVVAGRRHGAPFGPIDTNLVDSLLGWQLLVC